MIISRSPLRISLGGGGTDLPSYYEKHGGFLIAATIKSYVYVAIHKAFMRGIILKYSKMERVERASDILHPLFRESILAVDKNLNGVEISSFADIPSGTGLGSSGAFTCCLLNSILEYQNFKLTKKVLAELACEIEINHLHEPSGKQDQYASSFGGINAFTFQKSGEVDISPLNLSATNQNNIRDSLIMFFTGFARQSSVILSEQKIKTEAGNSEMIDNLHRTKEIGYRSFDALLNGDLELYGRLMHSHWQRKKQRSPSMVNSEIENIYNIAMENGAIGGKLVGAGGGGFLLFVTENKMKTRTALAELGLSEVNIDFEYSGTETIVTT